MSHPGLRRLQPLPIRELGTIRRVLLGVELPVQLLAVSLTEFAVVGIYVSYCDGGRAHMGLRGDLLVLITAVNLTNVKAFGEFEFWFAIINVVAIVAMIGIGAKIIFFGTGNGGHPPGISNL